MAHPKDDEVYYNGTVVRLKKTGEFCLIRKRVFLYPTGGGFMHYLGDIEGREGGKGYYVLYHDEVELECYPVCNLPST